MVSGVRTNDNSSYGIVIIRLLLFRNLHCQQYKYYLAISSRTEVDERTDAMVELRGSNHRNSEHIPLTFST